MLWNLCYTNVPLYTPIALYRDDSWRMYDLCYWHAAALQKNLHWWTSISTMKCSQEKPSQCCDANTALASIIDRATVFMHPKPSTVPRRETSDNTCYLYNSRTGNHMLISQLQVLPHLLKVPPHSSKNFMYIPKPQPKYQRTDQCDNRPQH